MSVPAATSVDPQPTPAPGAVPALGNSPVAPANPTQRKADDFADYPRDQWGRPLIVQLHPDGRPIMVWDKIDRKYVPLRLPYTRASRAGGVLEYEGALNSYHIRNAVIGITLREDLYYLAKSVHEPGGAGRREMDKDVVKPAQDAAGASSAANMGVALHSFCEKHDRGETVPPLGPYQAALNAYIGLTKGWRWHGIECRLISDRFRMAGKADRIGSPPGWMVAPDGTIIGPDDILALDLKSSSTDRYFGVKFAVQLCVYAYGDLYDLTTFARTPTGVRTDWALVIHVPSGGSSGALYWVNLKRGVELVHLAREVLDAQGEKGLVVKVADTAIYPTREDAEQAAAALLAGNAEGITVPDPEPDAAEGDPESPTVPADSVSALAEAAGVLIGDASCVIHGSHGGTVDCPECLELWKRDSSEAFARGAELELEPFDAWQARALANYAAGVADAAAEAEVTGDPEPAQIYRSPAGGWRASTSLPVGNRSTVPDSVTAKIRPDLGPFLQGLGERSQRARELDVIRQAGVTSPLEQTREQGWEWTDEHEAAYVGRQWELGIIAALQSCRTESALRQIADQVNGWGRWTQEMRVVARRVSDTISASGGDEQ